MRRFPVVLALLLVAPLVSAQVYKWKDAKGTTHYSETPPPTGIHYSQVTIAGGEQAVTPPTSASSAESSQQPSSSSSEAPQPPVADTPENRAKLCASLKANMATLRGNGPVVMQGAGGKQKLLDADQRKQQLDASQSQYSDYCSG